MTNLDNVRQTVESPDGLLLSKKQIPLAKTLYTEDFSNITFNYWCENSPNSYICWYVIFETISHILRHNSSIFFLAQTLHILCKSSSSKCKFSDFPLLTLKFTKFLMSFFKQKVSYSSKFGHSSVSWEVILLYFFSWNFICYLQKQNIKLHVFRFATACIKIHQIPHLIFGTKSQFFLSNFGLLFSVMIHNSSVLLHVNL